ncbi:MAG TPA: TonB family protein [Vicinamibacterales bacterium]|nr:TonB family protein [Vicinamibacterales bacterium]
MYFDFEDNRPDTPTIARSISTREGVLFSIVLHLLAVIAILVVPSLPFIKEAEARRQQSLEERRRLELERMRENARFVFVQPRVDTPAPEPPLRADLSDIDRQARTVERAPDPANSLPFSRGNSPERIEAERLKEGRREPVQPESRPAGPQPADTEQPRQGLNLPDSLTALLPKSAERNPKADNGSPALGVIADAIRNVQKYAQEEGFLNLKGGASQDFAPSIQFDTRGVEFGPWLRRFVAQIRSNWFIPYAAMSMRGHVVITFYVHKDGRITDVAVLKPSSVDGFTRSAQNAILASNPTVPLPPEYPEDRAFFTVTFYFNETPDR